MEKRFNIYLWTTRDIIIVTDDTPHALENFIAGYLDLDPEDDYDCERVVDILDEEISDIACDVPIGCVKSASEDDFDGDTHSVYCEF